MIRELRIAIPIACLAAANAAAVQPPVAAAPGMGSQRVFHTDSNLSPWGGAPRDSRASSEPALQHGAGDAPRLPPRSMYFELAPASLLPSVPAANSFTGVARVIPLPDWTSPFLSALVPGTGQLVYGQSRGAAYLAVEAFGWIKYARHRADGRRERAAYRSLASRVARAGFEEDAPVGDFEYYERMKQFVESGVFDMSQELGIQPETDETSFNGFLWRRARDTFWDDPNVPPPETSVQYTRALQFYEESAIRDPFRWSWRNAQLEHDLFRRTISRSNEAFRRSVEDLGVIIGNHVLSTVDANLSLRIRGSRRRGTRNVYLTRTLDLPLLSRRAGEQGAAGMSPAGAPIRSK